MNVYNYHAVSKEFVSISQAAESPLEPGVYLIPASATTVEVPATVTSGYAAVFQNGAWTEVEDHRGELRYATDTGIESTVTEFGPIAAGFTQLVPSENSTWNGSAWAFDSAKAMVKIRAARDSKLYACDFTQVADAPFTVEEKSLWAAYRQLLRDFPESCDPANPVWPTEPA